jgi:hypothetical protein
MDLFVMSMSQKPCVITVHGVGASRKGSTLKGLSKHYGEKLGAHYRAETLWVNGRDYASAASDNPGAPDLIEVNWADVQRSGAGWSATLKNLGRVIFASMHLAEGMGTSRLQKRCLTVFRSLTEIFTVWMVPHIVFVMALASFEPDRRWIPAFFGCGIILWAAVKTWSWSWSLRVGGGLAVGTYLATALFFVFWGRCEDVEAFTGWVSNNYANKQLILPLFFWLLMALTLGWPGRNGLSAQQRLIQLILFYGMVLAISVVGAVLWFVVSAQVPEPGYERWNSLHSQILDEKHYNMWKAEVTHLSLLVMLASLALAVAALYGVRRWRRTAGSGVGCRNGVLVIAAAIPILAAVLAWAVYKDVLLGAELENRDTYDIYRVSALRLIPFLPWILTPLRIIVDILGDVSFITLSDQHALSVRSEVCGRLENLLSWCRRDRRPVVVLSHSLGTVVAASSLSRGVAPEVSLVTTGSPLTSLHERFLDWSLREQEGFRGYPERWTNLWREADYVGGEVQIEDASVANENISPDGPEGSYGHLGYWDDAAVLSCVDRMLSESPQPQMA